MYNAIIFSSKFAQKSVHYTQQNIVSHSLYMVQLLKDTINLTICIKFFTHEKGHKPWLVWLSGLSAGMQTKGLSVRFPVRAHAWVAG